MCDEFSNIMDLHHEPLSPRTYVLNPGTPTFTAKKSNRFSRSYRTYETMTAEEEEEDLLEEQLVCRVAHQITASHEGRRGKG